MSWLNALRRRCVQNINTKCLFLDSVSFLLVETTQMLLLTSTRESVRMQQLRWAGSVFPGGPSWNREPARRLQFSRLPTPIGRRFSKERSNFIYIVLNTKEELSITGVQELWKLFNAAKDFQLTYLLTGVERCFFCTCWQELSFVSSAPFDRSWVLFLLHLLTGVEFCFFCTCWQELSVVSSAKFSGSRKCFWCDGIRRWRKKRSVEDGG